MRRLIAFALVLAACRGGDRPAPPASHAPTSTTAQRGPDPLMLRVPVRGGPARVVAYPNIDSTVWTAADPAPALDHVLAFDADAGLIAAVDSRALPVWIDLHVGSSTSPVRGQLRTLSSVDGSTIYGVGADGVIARYTPSGNSVFRTPQPARAVFPQLDGTILVLGGRGDGARIWRLHPPEVNVLDSMPVPGATTGTGSPLGVHDYLLTANHTLTGVHARTFTKGQPIALDHSVLSLASTPSGDRFYVLTDSSNALTVVDPYQEHVAARIDLPGRPRDLRVDPFGRFVLVRAMTGDSVWVVGIGTNKVVGTVRSRWRGDLPFVAADGAIAVADANDVVFLNSGSLMQVRRVAGGASDFWYPFVWSGLRPRAAALDARPAFPPDTDTSARRTPPAPDTIAAPRPAPSPDSAKTGFTVSFASLLNEAKAREQAAKITVNGQSARVVTSITDGTAIYRVVLGPFATRDEAERAGRAAGVTYFVYAGAP